MVLGVTLTKGQPSRPVLRGGRGGNAASLPDVIKIDLHGAFLSRLIRHLMAGFWHANYGGLMNLLLLIAVSAVQFLAPELVTIPASKVFRGHVAV